MWIIKNPRTAEKLFTFFVFIVVCAFSFSCSKKPSGLRTQAKKTDSINMNPVVSNQSEQQAQAQNIVYKIATVSFPEATENGLIIRSELLNPDNKYVPITTRHENGNLYAEGSFQDAARGVTVFIQSQCSGSECSKYLMLVTVTKNNKTLYQTAALSFSQDCHFYSISVANGVAQFFSNIEEFSSYTLEKNYSEKNDCPLEE